MYYLYCIARFMALLFPRRLSYFIASIISRFKYWTSWYDRQYVIYNLTPVLKDRKKAKRYALRVFENFAFYLADFFSFEKIDSRFIKRYVRLSGLDNLKKAIEEKRGIVALTAHIGNYELGGAITSYLGYDIYAIALPHRDKRINNFFNRQRGIFKVKVIPTGIAVKKCFKVLKDKKIIAFLGDKDFVAHNGEKVVICGRDVLLPRGPAFFALKTGSVIIPSFFVREDKYYYRLIFEPPIFPYKENGVPKETKELIEEYASVLERYIVNYPDQWYMFSRYWL